MRVLQKTVNLCKCCLTKLNVLLSIALLSCWSCWCSVFTSSRRSPWHSSLINQTPNIIPHKYTVAMLFLVLLSSLQSYLCKDRRLDTDCLQQHGTFPLYMWLNRFERLSGGILIAAFKCRFFFVNKRCSVEYCHRYLNNIWWL